MSGYSEVNEMLAMAHVAPESEVRRRETPARAPRARWWSRWRPSYESPYDAARTAENERQVELLRGSGGSIARTPEG